MTADCQPEAGNGKNKINGFSAQTDCRITVQDGGCSAKPENSDTIQDPASFRDPAGVVFQHGGEVFRQINPAGMADFDAFTASGLDRDLIRQGKLTDFEITESNQNRKLLRLEKIPFWSYPYEWCFSQWRDAALLTLDIELAALEKNLSLKDASAFNITFCQSRPVFVDHGSFEIYRENEAWRAYRQFVMHFLGPLLCMKYVDVRCGAAFLRNDLGGMPLELITGILPRRAFFSPGVLLHVWAHGKFEKRYSDTSGPSYSGSGGKALPVSKKSRQNLILSLRNLVESLRLPEKKSQWADYYIDNNYTPIAFEHKKELVYNFCRESGADKIVDFGANSGEFSQIAADCASTVISPDSDHGAVEMHYRKLSGSGKNIYPLLQDLNNPSPGCGLFNRERRPFSERSVSDAALGLALTHHLHISGNWPLTAIAEFFRAAAPRALIEFVPENDGQVKRLLRSRRPGEIVDWQADKFCAALEKTFGKVEIMPVKDSLRLLIRAGK